MLKPNPPAIKAIRGLKRLSYAELGERAGVTRQHARRIELGECGASEDVLTALATALDVSIDAISLPVREA